MQGGHFVYIPSLFYHTYIVYILLHTIPTFFTFLTNITAPQDAHRGSVLQVYPDLNTGIQCHVLEGLHSVCCRVETK